MIAFRAQRLEFDADPRPHLTTSTVGADQVLSRDLVARLPVAWTQHDADGVVGLAEPNHFGAEPDRPTSGPQMIMQHLLELILATDGEPGGGDGRDNLVGGQAELDNLTGRGEGRRDRHSQLIGLRTTADRGFQPPAAQDLHTAWTDARCLGEDREAPMLLDHEHAHP